MSQLGFRTVEWIPLASADTLPVGARTYRGPAEGEGTCLFARWQVVARIMTPLERRHGRWFPDRPVGRCLAHRPVAPPTPPIPALHLRSPFFQNVKCERETEIVVEQQPPQGVLVCDHAGRVANKLSSVLVLAACRPRLGPGQAASSLLLYYSS